MTTNATRFEARGYGIMRGIEPLLASCFRKEIAVELADKLNAHVALTARVAQLEAALRGIVKEVGPNFGRSDTGTIANINRIARAALK